MSEIYNCYIYSEIYNCYIYSGHNEAHIVQKERSTKNLTEHQNCTPKNDCRIESQIGIRVSTMLNQKEAQNYDKIDVGCPII
jgi:hypothetical protein